MTGIKLGNPDVGTAHQESPEADVDQHFKDLIEASSLGTPAASRIRASALEDVDNDVRLRLAALTEQLQAQVMATGSGTPAEQAQYQELTREADANNAACPSVSQASTHKMSVNKEIQEAFDQILWQ